MAQCIQGDGAPAVAECASCSGPVCENCVAQRSGEGVVCRNCAYSSALTGMEERRAHQVAAEPPSPPATRGRARTFGFAMLLVLVLAQVTAWASLRGSLPEPAPAVHVPAVGERRTALECVARMSTLARGGVAEDACPLAGSTFTRPAGGGLECPDPRAHGVDRLAVDGDGHAN